METTYLILKILLIILAMFIVILILSVGLVLHIVHIASEEERVRLKDENTKDLAKK